MQEIELKNDVRRYFRGCRCDQNDLHNNTASRHKL